MAMKVVQALDQLLEQAYAVLKVVVAVEVLLANQAEEITLVAEFHHLVPTTIMAT